MEGETNLRPVEKWKEFTVWSLSGLIFEQSSQHKCEIEVNFMDSG